MVRKKSQSDCKISGLRKLENEIGKIEKATVWIGTQSKREESSFSDMIGLRSL